MAVAHDRHSVDSVFVVVVAAVANFVVVAVVAAVPDNYSKIGAFCRAAVAAVVVGL